MPAFAPLDGPSSTGSAGAGRTSFVNGFQSTAGSFTAAAGIVWVTIRSIAFAMTRCRATPPSSAYCALSSSRRFQCERSRLPFGKRRSPFSESTWFM